MERFGSQGTTQFQPRGHLGYVAGDCAVGCVPFAAKVSCLPQAVLGGHEQYGFAHASGGAKARLCCEYLENNGTLRRQHQPGSVLPGWTSARHIRQACGDEGETGHPGGT